MANETTKKKQRTIKTGDGGVGILTKGRDSQARHIPGWFVPSRFPRLVHGAQGAGAPRLGLWWALEFPGLAVTLLCHVVYIVAL